MELVLVQAVHSDRETVFRFPSPRWFHVHLQRRRVRRFRISVPSVPRNQSATNIDLEGLRIRGSRSPPIWDSGSQESSRYYSETIECSRFQAAPVPRITHRANRIIGSPTDRGGPCRQPSHWEHHSRPLNLPKDTVVQTHNRPSEPIQRSPLLSSKRAVILFPVIPGELSRLKVVNRYPSN